MEVILHVGSLLYLISILLNSLGVYLLTAARPLTNSKFLLTNLAGTEILLSATQIAFNFVHVFSGEDAIVTVTKVLGAIWQGYYFSVIFLTIDRLIAIRFPFKYRILVTKKRLKWTILASWLLAIALGASLFLDDKWFNSFWGYVWISLDVVFIVLCITTYGYIFTKILQRRRLGNDNQGANNGVRERFAMNRERKFVKIVACILISFLLLFLIPDIIMHLYDSKELIYFLHVVWPIGIVIDPIIYIFLQDDLRLLLKRKIFHMNNEQSPSLQETSL